MTDSHSVRNSAIRCTPAASNFGHAPDVTTTSQITFLRASQGSTLYARSQELRRGRTTVYYETSVTDDTGALIARVTASGQVLA